MRNTDNVAPSIFLRFQNSLDNIDHDRNEKYSAALFKFFEEKLGVPGNRAYMFVQLLSLWSTIVLMLAPSQHFHRPRKVLYWVRVHCLAMPSGLDRHASRFKGTTFGSIFGRK